MLYFMDKNYSLAISFMRLVQSINFFFSWVVMVFLLYSIFALHPTSISIIDGITVVIITTVIWLFTLKILPMFYFLLPVALDMVWHGNSLSDLNTATIVATSIFFVAKLLTQVLAFKAVKYGYLDLQ